LEKNIQTTIPSEFTKGITEISIDASSIIYLLKIGLLYSLAAEVNLVTTECVYNEVEWPKLPVKIIEINCAGLTNDQTLLALADMRKNSLLSEDLEILKIAKASGWNYYNTLMMLNYLLLKGRVSESEYNVYLERLKEVSHYSKQVLEYGENVYKAILDFFGS